MGIDKFIKQNGRINTNLWNTSFFMFIYKWAKRSKWVFLAQNVSELQIMVVILNKIW